MGGGIATSFPEIARMVKRLGSGELLDYCMVHGGVRSDGERECDNWSSKNPTCEIRKSLIWYPFREPAHDRTTGVEDPPYDMEADYLQSFSRLSVVRGAILKQRCVTHSILMPGIAGACRRAADGTCDVRSVMVWPDPPLPPGGPDA